MIKQFDKVVLRPNINLPNFAPWQIQLWAALTCCSNVHSNSLRRIKQRMIDYDLFLGRLQWRLVAQVIWEHFWVTCLLVDGVAIRTSLRLRSWQSNRDSLKHNPVSQWVTGWQGYKENTISFASLLCFVSAIMCWLSFLFILSFTKNLCCDSA